MCGCCGRQYSVKRYVWCWGRGFVRSWMDLARMDLACSDLVVPPQKPTGFKPSGPSCTLHAKSFT